MKEIIIDGNNFSNEEEFYIEMDRLLTRNLGWKTGHNLDAFNDLLRGGFGVHAPGEELEITWIHASKSRKDLGYDATVRFWERHLNDWRNSNRPRTLELIENAKNHVGTTLFDMIVSIIEDTHNSGHICYLTMAN